MECIGWLRRAVTLVVMVMVTTLLAACAGSGADSGSEVPAFDRAPAQGDGGAAPLPQDESGGLPQEDGDPDSGKMIIRSKVLRLEVESTPDTVTAIRDLTRTHNGTVSDMKVATDVEEWLYHYDEQGLPVGDGAALRGWVTVRVPSESYEDFVAAVAELGSIKYQSEATDDVTQQHVDLSARLENLRAQEARLRDFFDAAVDVEDMLAIEDELGRVRGDIESLDAQVTYLERQAAMATVTVELSQPRAVVRPEGQSWGFVEAITTGIRGAAQLITGVLTVVIALSPLWLAGLLLFFPIRAAVRRRRAKTRPVTQATAGPAPSADSSTPVTPNT